MTNKVKGKTAKYSNWKELIAGFKSGALKNYTVIMDSDDSFLRYTGPLPKGVEPETEEADSYMDEMNDIARLLFRGNGYYDIIEILKAIDIPVERC